MNKPFPYTQYCDVEDCNQGFASASWHLKYNVHVLSCKGSCDSCISLHARCLLLYLHIQDVSTNLVEVNKEMQDTMKSSLFKRELIDFIQVRDESLVQQVLTEENIRI